LKYCYLDINQLIIQIIVLCTYDQRIEQHTIHI